MPGPSTAPATTVTSITWAEVVVSATVEVVVAIVVVVVGSVVVVGTVVVVEVVVVAASPPPQATTNATIPVRIAILVRMGGTLDPCPPNRLSLA